MRLSLILIIALAKRTASSDECEEKSVTTASGTHAPSGEYCRGQLIFEDNFDVFNFRKWQHEITLTGSAVSTRLLFLPHIQQTKMNRQ